MQQNNLEIKRHSCAHLVAAAVQALYPNAKFGVGPVVENGFYYDIEFPEKVSEEVLEKIEKKARELTKAKLAFEREEMSLEEAIKFFRKIKQNYKIELLRDLKKRGTTKMSSEELQDVGQSVKTVSLYRTGDFIDLCRGPHVKNTAELNLDSLKLTRLAGAYWRGSEKNSMLTRVYGVYFESKKELDDYLRMIEEAEKRDHRRLGQELDLFHFSDLVGAGLPLFTGKGTLIREELKKFIWELMEPYGYTRVTIPHIAKSDLYKVSGHWDKFADDIFHVASRKTEQEFVLKPMNCPHHTQIFASRSRSYRDLPIRMSEVTAVYRDENTGQLQGLSRVRSITQDDAHVFCRLDQVEEEVKALYDIIQKFYQPFGMPLEVGLSLSDPKQPEKYLGERPVWDKAESILRNLLGDLKVEFAEMIGEAAFYGPKIDFIAKDAIGRKWQLATIQLDFNLPERFALEYTDSEGKKTRPVMLHRAVLGSVERFMSVLIEHYAGAFPVWLAPVQVLFAPVSAKHLKGAKKLAEEFKQAGIRVEVDEADETLGNKVRKAAGQKIPYILVIGDKELAGEELMVRVRGLEKQEKMSKEKFISRLKTEIEQRKS